MNKYLSSLLLLTTPILWGLAFSAQKDVSALGAFTIGSIRSILATVFLFLAIPLLDKVTGNGRRLFGRRGLDFNRSELIGGVACGAVLALGSALQQSGICDGADAGKAAFISALYVIIVPIMYLALGKKSPVTVWISVLIAVVGFYLLSIKQGFSVELTDLIILISAAVFAGHIIVIDYFSPRCDGVRLSCIQFLTAAVVNTIVALIAESPIDLSLIAEKLPSLAYLGICSSGIAYTVQIICQRSTPPAVASTILSLESVFGALGAAFIHGERMTEREYLGCAIVFAAVILAQIDFKEIINNLKNKKKSNN